ncbi:MAG: hypothetical protein GVY30_08525 [Chloroflexi bacterium]|nr:hypothetical protein [Chloroflexota bacterium]
MIKKQALLWGIFSLFLFSLAHLGIQSSDDAATLATAGALWDRHTLAIPDMMWLDERVDIGHCSDGILYSKYGLGQTVAAAALYGMGDVLFPQSEAFQWAGYEIAASQAGAILAQHTNVLLGAILVGLVVYAGGRRAPPHHPEAAILASMLLTLASPLWHAARGFGTEIGAALGLFIAVLLARRARAPASTTPLWLSAIGLGIAALFRPSALIFSAAWIAWLWDRPRRDWISMAIASGVILLGLAGYNWIRYGDLLEFGYGDDGARFALHLDSLVSGLGGYILAPGRGLLIFAPWTLFIIPQAGQAWRARDLDDIGALSGIACFYGFHALWRDWEGGYAFGPRLLIPILPIIAFLITDALPTWLRRGRHLLSMLSFLPGSLMQMAALAGDPLETYLHIRTGDVSFAQTVWSLRHNIAAQQIKAAATPEHSIWLLLWSILALAWIGYCDLHINLYINQKKAGKSAGENNAGERRTQR